VVVAGGSDRYSGCLTFNGLAALRTGADLAVVVAPRRAADIVATHSPDLISIPSNRPFPDPDLVREVSSNADALVVGCGVIRTLEAHRALLSILKTSHVPVVVDAEALHALARNPGITAGKNFLLTPNSGEFRVLSGLSWPGSNPERRTVIKTFAKRFKSTVIVKGALDYISDGVRVTVDREGSPYLTKGGYGDLLAGSAGAFLARGYSPFEAAKFAAFLVGRAGMMAARELGEGTLASDTLRYLPRVTRKDAMS